MADKKISELDEKTTIADTDMFPMVDEEATPDTTKKITGANLKSQVLASSTASVVKVSKLTGATYDDVQDWINNTQSSGRISGGDIADNGDGSVTVAAGTGFIKISDSEIAETKFFDWAEDDSVSLVDNDVNYIYVDYNAGSPQILATTDRTAIRLTDQFTLGRVYRSGTTIHILDIGVDLFNQVRREHERLLTVRGFERGSGGEISETGQRYLQSTAGVFYLGHKKITTSAQDTSGTDKFTAWYYNGSAWVSVADQTQISNTQYNDTSSGLSNLSANRYGVHWIYIDYDGRIHSIYGQDDYKLAEAELALAPGNIPDILNDFAILVAKIIVKKDATNFTSVVSAYDTLFPISTPFEHNDLSGMQGGTADEYYHLTQSQHDNNVIKTGSLTAGKMVKANADGVVEDASNTDAEVADAVSKKHTQGTDTALGSLGTKDTPVDADKVIHRNSENSDALVTSTWTQIKAFFKTYFDTLYSVLGHTHTSIQDADNDTKIQVEESADEDKIRMDVEGVEAFLLDNLGILTLAKQSSIVATISADQEIPDSMGVRIMFDGVDTDTQDEFDDRHGSGTAETGTSGTTLHDDGAFVDAQAGDIVYNTTDTTYSVIASVTSNDEVELEDAIFAVGDSFKWYRGQFKAKSAGVYLTILSIRMEQTDQKKYQAYVVSSGSGSTSTSHWGSVTNGYMNMNVATICELSVNDTIHANIYQDTGGTATLYKQAGKLLIAKIA